jgi:lipopolysaccharide exporter
MPVTELLEPTCATLFPGFALSQRDGTSPVGMALSIAGALALVTIPFSIAVSAASGYLVVGLLGPQWQGSRDIIAILAWVCVFSPFSYVCSSVLSAQGRVKRAFIVNAISALIKVIVVLIVRETHDLQLIALSAVAVVGVESLLFICQLREVGATGIRQLATTAIRAVLAAAVTTIILSLLPGTWSVVTLDKFSALACGIAIGIATFIIFAACQTGLWFFAGRPSGFEQQVIGIVRRVAFRAPSPQAAGD